jgi:hypothetical protein
MGSWADYTFRMNKLHSNFKRSDIDHVDNDYMMFAVSRGNDLFVASACQPGNSGFVDNVESGNDLPLFDQGDNVGWAIGPITINDDDMVVVTFAVTNLSYTDAATQTEQQLKITGAWLASVGAALAIGGAAAAEVPPAAAAIFAAVGAIMEFIGGTFHWLGLGGQTNCNGPVSSRHPSPSPGHNCSSWIIRLYLICPGT